MFSLCLFSVWFTLFYCCDAWRLLCLMTNGVFCFGMRLSECFVDVVFAVLLFFNVLCCLALRVC